VGEGVLVGAPLEGQVLRDAAGADQVGEGAVHGLHAVPASRLYGAGDLVRAALADVMSDGGCGHEDLAGDAAPPAVPCREQLLGADALERGRELHAHLRLLMRREHVDDAVHGLGGILGVQRGEHEVAGLGRRERRRDRLEVAHLADQDDVRVLAERALERTVEAFGVGPDLALIDVALLVAVKELDRVLDGDDVLVAGLVDLVDHRRQSGGLAGSGRAGDDHEAAGLLRELVKDVGQAELVEPWDVDGDQPEGRAQAVALEEGVHAEARLPGHRIGEVDLPLVLEALPLVLGEDRVDELAGVRLREARVLERLEDAVDADDGRIADPQVEVARAALQNLEKDVDDVHCRPLDRRPMTDIL